MSVTGRTRVAAVVGSPIRHSLSPVVFNAAFAACDLDWAYAAFDVPSGSGSAALDAMRVLGLAGLSVTMPLKEEVAAAVDECSPDAAALGAVNCVVPVEGRPGRLRGESTDGEGFVRSLLAAGLDPAGARCLVVGAGGAARAVVVALARRGAAGVVVANRTEEKAQRAAALAGPAGSVLALDELDALDGELAAAELVVNATSVGMGGSGLPLPVDRLRSGQVVADLVYQPVRTELLRAAAAAGCRTVDGVGMLVHQAALAFELWTGLDAPLAAMLEAAAGHLGDGGATTGPGEKIAPTS
jgi:shikimate dehydrogenase